MTHSPKAFTLVELMIVIAIIGILAAALFPSMTSYLARSRDTVRFTQAKNIISGNELFRAERGRYANPSNDTECGGWDTPHDGVFMTELTSYMKFKNSDGTSSPFPIGNQCGWIQYYRYAAGNGGCPPEKGAFYVILVHRVNDSVIWDNPGFSCSGGTDFGTWYHPPSLPVPAVSGVFEN